MKLKRYGLYLANLDPTMGSEIRKTRPVVIVSDNSMNEYLETVVVCPLTTQIHAAWKSRIAILCQGKEAEIVVDQIRTISKKRLIKRLDKITSEDSRKLRLLITEMYGETS
ncbi:MAG: type II toxin-antitoxin system PemK/MazF family toxin [Candidatus Thiodiazotropha sp.]